MKKFKFKDIRKFLDKPPGLTLNVAEGHKARYKLEMKNEYLNPAGGVARRQFLRSVYTREIKEKLRDILYLTEIKVEHVNFENKTKNMNWTFAEGTILPHYLYYNHYSDEFLFISKQFTEGRLKDQMINMAQTFMKFPKLPSVSLFILHVWDIIGFEDLSGQALSNPFLLQNPGVALEIRTLTDTHCDLKGGSFAQGSHFTNKKVFAIHHGFTFSHGKPCLVYEFFCDGAKLDTADLINTKEGSSTYSFVIHMDMETGLIMKGFLTEYIYAAQWNNREKTKKIPSNARRRITLELLEDAA